MIDNITKITMVGPTGVGKTSLLASMYHRIKPELDDLGCTFTAGPGCENELTESVEALAELATGQGKRVNLDLGVKPSSGRHEYDFKLHVRGEATIPNVDLRFVDLPGGWYTGQGAFLEADQCILESNCVIIAVEAWALMEDPQKDGIGKYHKKINKPTQIIGALDRASQKLNGATPPLLLFVLVKSEKYLHHGERDKLFECARKAYEPLLSSLKSEKFKIAGCCVETVGGIELNSVQEVDGRPIGTFIRLSGNEGGYNPRHCSVPLRLVFQLALIQAHSKIDREGCPWYLGGPIADLFIEILGFETALSKQLEKSEKLQTIIKSLSSKLEGEPLVWYNGNSLHR